MKRRSPEEIVLLLREAESSSESIVDFCRRKGISDQTFYRWRQQYGGLDVDEAKRLKQLEVENAKLKKLVAACHARKIQLLLYFGYELSNIAPEWQQHSEECLVFPRAGGYKRKPEQTAYIVCYRSHWQDFLADGFQIGSAMTINRTYTDCNIDGPGCQYFYVAINHVPLGRPSVTATEGASTITVTRTKKAPPASTAPHSSRRDLRRDDAPPAAKLAVCGCRTLRTPD